MVIYMGPTSEGEVVEFYNISDRHNIIDRFIMVNLITQYIKVDIYAS